MTTYLSSDHLSRALALRDLTDPSAGPHAMQRLLADVVARLTAAWGVPACTLRHPPLVAVADNYDKLGYDSAAVTREARYSRYVSPTVMLRSHTSSAVPARLESYRTQAEDVDELLVVPGLVYRRDAVDRTHVGEPHQVDLWRVASSARLTPADLRTMVAEVACAVLPGAVWRAEPAHHPHTVGGLQVDVRHDGRWLELAECGLVAPGVLARAGLDPARWSGLALGMGLDRALMLRKGVPDIRHLRSSDPRVTAQMRDLEPWRPVSQLPPVQRDLSLVVDATADVETLGDRTRTALADRADDLESVDLLALTAHEDLPPVARRRLGTVPGQANALVRLVLRPLGRTMTDQEANGIRDLVYAALHEGPHLELIGTGPRPGAARPPAGTG